MIFRQYILNSLGNRIIFILFNLISFSLINVINQKQYNIYLKNF
jgi:hypothetical protein